MINKSATHDTPICQCYGQVCTPPYLKYSLIVSKLPRNTTSKLRHTGCQRSRPKIT